MRRLFPNAGADEKPGIFFTWPKQGRLYIRHKLPSKYGRDYFAGLKVTKRNKATVLLTLTLLQTPTLTMTLILTLTLI